MRRAMNSTIDQFTLDIKPSGRGFLRAGFKDREGENCSIQESPVKGFTNCLLLGRNDPMDGHPARMLLNRKMARALGRALMDFKTFGNLSPTRATNWEDTITWRAGRNIEICMASFVVMLIVGGAMQSRLLVIIGTLPTLVYFALSVLVGLLDCIAGLVKGDPFTLGVPQATDGGRLRTDFRDRDGMECSIEESPPVMAEECVWLGRDKETDNISNESTAQMRLTREMVGELAFALIDFARDGTLSANGSRISRRLNELESKIADEQLQIRGRAIKSMVAGLAFALMCIIMIMSTDLPPKLTTIMWVASPIIVFLEGVVLTYGLLRIRKLRWELRRRSELSAYVQRAAK